MNLKDKIFIVYCPSCDIHSINNDLIDAEHKKWKHYWKSKEDHVKEEDIIIAEYNKA